MPTHDLDLVIVVDIGSGGGTSAPAGLLAARVWCRGVGKSGLHERPGRRRLGARFLLLLAVRLVFLHVTEENNDMSLMA